MRFLTELITILEWKMKEPPLYGWFHFLCSDYGVSWVHDSSSNNPSIKNLYLGGYCL